MDEMENAGMMAAFQKAKLSALSGDEGMYPHTATLQLTATCY